MSTSSDDSPPPVLLYQAEDGAFRLDVPVDGDTVWLSLNQMATLFERNKSTISRHLANIFDEGELSEDSVVANFATTAVDGKIYQVGHYNLDVIISVGYRVKSLRGTQFRIWATNHLREFLVKGFTMDDQRFKQEGGGRYFEELLQRIRDIRSSEKVFWRKVLDIFSTSIDYSPKAQQALEFFAKVQNQLHWAAHGQTAAEVIYQRADADQPNMGITNFPGNALLQRDTEVAKNYLAEEELNLLNRIVTAYLELAEIQALNQMQMSMTDWSERLQQFLTMTGRDILTHAGSISRDQAIDKAHKEYAEFKRKELLGPSIAELDFLATTEKELKTLEQKLKGPRD